MKKLLTALLATVLMVQTFSFAAYAATTITYDVDTDIVSVETDEFEAGQQVSLVGFYQPATDEEVVVAAAALVIDLAAADYLNQYAVEATEEGDILNVEYPSKADLADGGVITVYLNGVATSETIGDIGGDEGFITEIEFAENVGGITTMRRGTTLTVAAVTDNENAVLTWVSSNEAVATVENGVIKALKPGMAIITVSGSTADGGTLESTIVLQVR